MNNITVIYGEEDFLIKKEIEDIQKKYNDEQIIRYDLSEVNVSELLEDALMVSLFNDKKIILGYNAYFLSGVVVKEAVNHNIKMLEEYINHPNPDTTIIFIVNTEKLDKRKNIVKKLMEHASVKEINKLNDNDLLKYIKKICESNGYQITFKALNLLMDKTSNNLSLINSECEKLFLYKMDDRKIDECDIEEMVSKYDFDNIFALTDAVMKKDIDTSLSLYQELLKRNEEPIKIIVLLANQFRLIYQVKRLHSKGFSESQIASELGVHPYRVKLARENTIKENQLLTYIKELADLDADIKMGKTNKNVGLELFLLKI